MQWAEALSFFFGHVLHKDNVYTTAHPAGGGLPDDEKENALEKPQDTKTTKAAKRKAAHMADYFAGVGFLRAAGVCLRREKNEAANHAFGQDPGQADCDGGD